MAPPADTQRPMQEAKSLGVRPRHDPLPPPPPNRTPHTSTPPTGLIATGKGSNWYSSKAGPLPMGHYPNTHENGTEFCESEDA
jgi:hypothetical protein